MRVPVLGWFSREARGEPLSFEGAGFATARPKTLLRAGRLGSKEELARVSCKGIPFLVVVRGNQRESTILGLTHFKTHLALKGRGKRAEDMPFTHVRADGFKIEVYNRQRYNHIPWLGKAKRMGVAAWSSTACSPESEPQAPLSCSPSCLLENGPLSVWTPSACLAGDRFQGKSADGPCMAQSFHSSHGHPKPHRPLLHLGYLNENCCGFNGTSSFLVPPCCSLENPPGTCLASFGARFVPNLW